MKIIYMGTPDFAVLPLKRLMQSGHEILLTVTQPDKPTGRKQILTPPPVKVTAEQYNIPVYQPEKLKTDETYEMLSKYNADVFVVVAYGKILPQSILDIPPYGCINVHASLLPRLRGAAPIQWSIMRDCKQTGVTTMYMEKGLDTGDMLLKKSIDISESETGEGLHDKLSVIGADLIVQTLEKLEGGELQREKQDDSLSDYAPMIDKNVARIDFSKPCRDIYNLIRAMNSYPYANTVLEGKMLKVICAEYKTGNYSGKTGEIVDVNDDGICVKADDGIVILKEIQLEGKKRMTVKDFLKGNKIIKSIMLG